MQFGFPNFQSTLSEKLLHIFDAVFLRFGVHLHRFPGTSFLVRHAMQTHFVGPHKSLAANITTRNTMKCITTKLGIIGNVLRMRFLPCMNHFVELEVIGIGKGSRTNITLVRAFLSMYPRK